jgi:hypothetical protein
LGGSQTVMASPVSTTFAFHPGRHAALVHGRGNDLELHLRMVPRHHLRDLAARQVFHVHHKNGA